MTIPTPGPSAGGDATKAPADFASAPRRPRLAQPLAALICDLDGVITDTAATHASAWKALFDGYLAERSARTGTAFQPFSIAQDYITLVDGRPRYDGVDAFLRARGIALPWGNPEDPPGVETVCGLGNLKNTHFNDTLDREGVTVFPGAVAVVRTLRDLGGTAAVVSSSKNCGRVLETAGLADLFDARVDGLMAASLGLPGKPAPDTFVEGARRIGVAPAAAAVVEDAVAGVAAGRAGNFGLVIGIDRGAGAAALYDGGADLVLRDLGDLLPDLPRLVGASATHASAAAAPPPPDHPA